MTNNLKQIIDKVITYMLINNVLYPFGLQTLETNIEIVNDKKIPSPGYFKPDVNKIYINEYFIDNYMKLNTDEFIVFVFTVVLHELSHVVLLHDKRLNKRNIQLWNIATDYMINTTLMNILIKENNNNIIINNVCINTSNVKRILSDNFLYDEKYMNMSEEEIYNLLYKNAKKISIVYEDKERIIIEYDDKKVIINKNNKSNKDNKNNKGGKDNKNNEKDENDKNNKGNDGNEDNEDNEDNGCNVSNEEIGYISNVIFKEYINKGSFSKEHTEYLKKIFKVKIDWKKILKDVLRTTLIKSDTLGWSKVRTTSFVIGTYLPGFIEEEEYNKIIIALDESGSITNNDLQKFIDIVLQSKQYFKEIIVMKHDVNVVEMKKFNIEETKEDEIKKCILKRVAGGGTSHRDVFENVKKIMIKENDIDLLLLVTDGESDIEEIQDKYINFLPKTVCLLTRENNKIKFEKILIQ